ncbi:MAG: hypothetical protein JSU63_17130 [Phycisphaerales bacterium]|nr:MAG: hypothetical protein JSU63_17130 [Phycisphaerales bacterium]
MRSVENIKKLLIFIIQRMSLGPVAIRDDRAQAIPEGRYHELHLRQ